MSHIIHRYCIITASRRAWRFSINPCTITCIFITIGLTPWECFFCIMENLPCEKVKFRNNLENILDENTNKNMILSITEKIKSFTFLRRTRHDLSGSLSKKKNQDCQINHLPLTRKHRYRDNKQP